jgi:type IV pilus assembly protein PilM
LGIKGKIVLSFRKKKPPVLGIDISSTSVKIVELSRSGDRYRVDSYAVEPLPANAVVEKNIAEVEAVGETISKALKRSNIKNKNCAMAVPASAVITKIITMPANLNENDMEGQIQLEADQYIPYALEEVNLDFEVLGPTEGNPETVDVLLAASRSENVDLRIGAADIAGLTADIIDIESYALENAYKLIEPNTEGRVVAIIDVGATMTNINVVADNVLVYNREQPFGGKQLTEEIMRRYGLSYEEAGLAKKEGSLPDNYVPEVLEPFKETMAQQVHRFLQFFYAASQHNSVDQLVLAGGCAAIPGIDELIESRVGVETSIANPFANMAMSSRINQQRLSNDAPSLMIACGLALRSFD